MPAAARFALVLAAALLMLAGLFAGAASSSGPSPATGSGSCNIKGKERHLGPTYVTSLRVKGVSCATGERIVRRYYQCRVKAGGKKGRCHSRVLGFTCHEKRLSAISTEFDARVTCTRGSDRVWHNYTQFT